MVWKNNVIPYASVWRLAILIYKDDFIVVDAAQFYNIIQRIGPNKIGQETFHECW